MAVLNISDEVYALLQERAEVVGLTPKRLAEVLLTQVLDENVEIIHYSSPEELAELKKRIVEDKEEEAAGIGIPMEDAVKNIREKLKNKKAQKASA
jgi:hypothetical protein